MFSLTNSSMRDFEIIKGQQLHDILKQLVAQKTLINLVIPGIDYERLIILSCINTTNNTSIITIDPPEDLNEVISTHQVKSFEFKFRGKEGLRHHFIAQLISQDNRGLHLEEPVFLKRYQFRNSFRIKAPRGAELIVCIDDKKISMVIENISVGGVFCFCFNTHLKVLQTRKLLNNLQLIFTLKSECVLVPIQKAEVRRIEQEGRPNQFGIAYSFIQIKREAKRLLTHQIYELQREYLQNRLKIGE
jgi:c-di-GMP-binding flagellar brake protein YcgR